MGGFGRPVVICKWTGIDGGGSLRAFATHERYMVVIIVVKCIILHVHQGRRQRRTAYQGPRREKPSLGSRSSLEAVFVFRKVKKKLRAEIVLKNILFKYSKF